MEPSNDLENILKSSGSMNESSGSQLSRTTNVIQSAPETIDRSRLIMIFLINLGVAR